MSDLQGPPAELRFTVSITRAATGKTEVIEMVGTPLPAEKEEDGRHPQRDSTQRSD